MDLQAEDRAHRIGQKKTVNVYRLVTQGTVEEMIVERAQMKLRLDTLIIQQGRLREKANLSKEDMLEMIRHGANEVFVSTENGIEDEAIDEILAKGKERTAALAKSIDKALPSDEQWGYGSGVTRRLLNFKVDHQSIRVFDGVDYQAKKKEKEQQLKQLMLQEMEVEQTRRKRKTMNYAELAKEEAPQHKPTHVVRLPFMQPFQVAVVFGREA